MDLFAHAAFGIIPEDKLHTQLERYIEEIMNEVLPGENMEWGQALDKAGKMPRVRKIISDLGFPDSAALIGVEKTEDGSELGDGTLVIGWGLMAFPEICYSDGFRSALTSKLDMKWHLWVSS